MASVSRHILGCEVRAVPACTATLDQVAHALPDRPGSVLLESLQSIVHDQPDDHGRYCIAAFDPIEIVAPRDGDALQQVAERQPSECPDVAGPLPLVGGWIGFLGYEAGRSLERLPERAVEDLGLPRAWFGCFDTVAVFDRHHRRWFIAGVEWAGDTRPPLAQRLDHMAGFLNAAQRTAPPAPAEPAAQPGCFDQAAYEQDVRTILEHIRAGDIYQANLTRRVQVRGVDSPRLLYRRLRRANPANYAAWLRCGDFEVLSSSPELFLQVRAGQVVTRPIKGTRPRGLDPAQDTALRRELAASDKDLAELAMIVDVERNDLGRVCRDIEVTWPPAVESHPSVHHLVAEVRGVLPSNGDPFELLRATFPGGSITGAPKIRAMEIIDELEPVARGPYCGTIGFVGFCGRMTMSVAIRTMVVRGSIAYVHVGSGIVADSVPADEHAELHAKARGMMAALVRESGEFATTCAPLPAGGHR